METGITLRWVIHILCLVVPAVISDPNHLSISGKSFTLAFFPEDRYGPTNELTNMLYMSSAHPGTCNITFNDGTHRNISVVQLRPGEFVEEALPDITEYQNTKPTGVEAKAIYVNCDADVTLYGYNRHHRLGGISEPFVMIPDEFLTEEYIVSSVNKTAFIGVVALYDNTDVVFNTRLTCTYNYDNVTYGPGHSHFIDVTLHRNEVFRLGGKSTSKDDDCDLGATIVTSNNPVSVFSGALSYEVSAGENSFHLVRQVLPSDDFTNEIIVPSLDNSTMKRMVVHILAKGISYINITSECKTKVKKDHLILSRGQYSIFTFDPDVNVVIQSSNSPIMVTQRDLFRSQGGSLMTIPGTSQYVNSVLVKGFLAYGITHIEVTVVTATSAFKDVLVNGAPPPSISWTHLSTLPYSVGRFAISNGQTYNITCSAPMLVRVDQESIRTQSSSYIAGFTLDRVDKSGVELVCHEGGWEVRADLKMLKISPSNHSIPRLHLSDWHCTGTLTTSPSDGRYQISFNYSYAECNTLTQKLGGMVVYKNHLVFADQYNDDEEWHVDLKCSLPAANSGSVHLYPGHYGHGLGAISGTISERSVHVALFNDKNFQHQVRWHALKAEIGEPVYVQVSTQNTNAVMIVHTCDAHLEDGKNVSFPLIENGCAIEPRTRILVSRNQVTRFQFEVFDIKYASHGIYVTCHVTFCDPMNFSAECQQGCKTSPHGAIIGK